MESLSAAGKALDVELEGAIAADPVDALTGITEIRALVSVREREAVRRALDDHTWAEVGKALGVSKQAAFQRFGKEWVTEAKAEIKSGTTDTKKLVAERLRSKLRA
ncbi:MAG TPA: hypothetical protein VIO13_01135 [Candidatus Dormibacteraeota bacterium]|jgi:hypothetical protein